MAEREDSVHRVLIKNGIVVSGGKERQADMLIEDGRIVRTEKDIMLGSLLRHAESELLDAEGCYVFPGFIDAFTQFEAEVFIEGQQESVRSPDDFESGTKAALAGGTTSIINCALQKNGQSLQDALDAQHASALHKSSCNYGFHITLTPMKQKTGEDAKTVPEKTGEIPQENAENLPDEKTESITEQMTKTVLRGVSSYTVSMSGFNLQLSDSEIFEILNAAKEHGALVCCRCENGDMVRHLVEEQLKNKRKRPSSHPISRPPAVEAEAVSRFLSLAQLADVPVYILDVSAKQSLEQIKLAKKRGQLFFCGTAPQYLLLTDSLYRKGGFDGAKFICNPPLRKKQDLKALQKELMRGKADLIPGSKDNSYIDIICSDHAAFDLAEREKAAKKSFSKAAPGLPGAQYRSSLIFTAADVGSEPDAQDSAPADTDNKKLAPNFRLTPARFSALVSENPARIFGLYPDRGTLAVGATADITVWDPSPAAVIGESNNLHKGGYTPYEGIRVRGQAKYVLLGGKVCVKGGTVVEEKQGRYLFRKTGYPAFN